jgi:ankyrin repeat protein
MYLVVLSQTALHWAAKHGNADVVKLIAGTYQADVNVRSVSVLHVTIRQPICPSSLSLCTSYPP